MTRCVRVGLIGMVLVLSSCSVFTEVMFSSFRFGSHDDDRSAAERRERNEASRERVQGARLSTDRYERKED